MGTYILGIDQSTQGTKALIFDKQGRLIARADKPHKQIVNEKGWVSHDLQEIYANTVSVVKMAVKKAGIDKEELACVGISNQRETSAAWQRNAVGTPVCDAIVWQCARAQEICERIEARDEAPEIVKRTGIRLSPYFPAAKLAWILENFPEARTLCDEGQLCLGTMDTYLIYRLTHGRVYKTDYSNASRTQLFNIETLSWDERLGKIFGIPISALATCTDSDGDFGETDFEGYLPHPIPICGVLGDSHAALFAQGCLQPGMIKATYGTGSSIMMNIGTSPVRSLSGVVTSLAWKMNGKVNYVLEGNINYTGAVITWLKDDLKMIGSAAETEARAEAADSSDASYLVPAFSGLGAPYWNSRARALLCFMSRTTRREEIVKDALECIAYQISDVIRAMERDTGRKVQELRVDGGPTHNRYLMQFQSDIVNAPVLVSSVEELSGMGAAYAAGISRGAYTIDLLTKNVGRTVYQPKMKASERDAKYAGWLSAVAMATGQQRQAASGETMPKEI